MSFGFNGKILKLNLTFETIEELQLGDIFYRTYMGGSAIGSYFLLKNTKPETDPLSEENIIVIAPGITTGAKLSGASRCCVTALSPLTNTIGDGQAGGNIGRMIKQAGFDAVVIEGRAKKLSYIFIENSSVKIIDCTHLSGKTVADAHDFLSNELGAKELSVLQCGPAGEKLVRFSNIMADLNDSVGRAGLGAVMGSKNLRAVVVKGNKEINFYNNQGIANLNKLAAGRLKDSGFPNILSKHGTPGVVKFQAESGNFATHNYSQGCHQEYSKLDGSAYDSEIGSRKTTCYGCIVGCRKTVKTEKPYKVTDKLGGPEFETLGLLGANLDITDPAAVAKANELCNNYGIDTITMGGIAGYIFECVEKGLIKSEQINEETLQFGNPDSLFCLIEKTANRTGVGDILADSFEAMIKYFGQKTEPYAVHVKGEGLPVHMPQVKPSLALMYAVCPIGPDHMSSEHDWLIASDSEASKGLGLTGTDTTGSTGLAKVRMTVYSQIFFSLLDTLSLCMFCWGPGNLFTYNELVNFLNFVTGWDVTLWELMKVGERRINMMRQINAKRGFTKDNDILPSRLFEPITEGPSKNKHVDKKAFEYMKEQYFAMMGWDNDTGNPTEGKLTELGLEWTI